MRERERESAQWKGLGLDKQAVLAFRIISRFRI